MYSIQRISLCAVALLLLLNSCTESTLQPSEDLVHQSEIVESPEPDQGVQNTQPTEPVCGDGQCNGLETPTDCIIDCPICGDKICSSGESHDNCPEDCLKNNPGSTPAQTCGDGQCGSGETPELCPLDCKGPNQTPGFPDPDPNHSITGYVDGVFDQEQGWVVQGWACHMTWAGSINVELYVGGPEDSGTFIKSLLANAPQEAAVGNACGTQLGQHRYKIPLTESELNDHAGEVVHVYGVSPIDGSKKELQMSGLSYIPGIASSSDCSGCLGGAGSCSEACQGIGFSDGFCKFPGSTDATSCCECSNSPIQGSGPTGTSPPLNLDTVTWLHVDVGDWPETTTLNVSLQGPNICFDYGTQNSWPTQQIPHNSGNHMIDVIANPWVFIHHQGQWYAGTWEWFVPGSACKSKTAVAGDHIKQPPFGPMNWTPTSGETLYFMVAGLSRFSNISNVQERSNLVKIVWP